MISDFLKQVLGQNAAQIASAFMTGLDQNSGPVREVLDEVSAWATALAKNAVLKWAPRLVYGRKCEQGACGGPGFVVCDACGKAACLSHARIDYAGEGTCASCVEEVIRQKRAAWEWPERPKRARRAPATKKPAVKRNVIDEAFDVLGVPRDAPWDDVKARYRSLVFDMSPDREQNEAEKLRKTERMKRLNVAFALLEKYYERRAA